MDLSRFKVLTFDCYGTLIDWETGILTALRPVLAKHSVALTDAGALERYARFESQIQAGDYLRYREVLRRVMLRFGEEFGFTCSEAEANALGDSLGDWPPFPDTVAALQELKRRYRLVILSNTDDDLFALTTRRLQVAFDDVITAEQVGSYKPSLRNFETAIARIGVPKEQLLHIAQSLYHDVMPAKSLGIATVWVNRRQGKAGGGATVPSNAQPDLEVPDLQTLASLTGAGEL